MMEPTAAERGSASADELALDVIAEALRGLCYGQLELHVHEGRVVKIMRIEKIRLFEACTTNARCTNPA